jgi:pimeloyl-ACP methyl ester carboxylesterase
MTGAAEPAPDRQVLEFSGRDGNKLAADGFGDPAMPPVLLAHGGGQTRHSWRHAGVALAFNGWYAVTLDLRGHGDSEWVSNGDYTDDAIAGDLLAVARSLGPRPVLVGASMGGIASLLVEGELAPGTAAAVVLVDIAPRIELVGVERIRGFMLGHLDGFAAIDDAADAVAAYNSHRPRPADSSGLAKNLRKGPDGRFRWHWDPKVMTERELIDPAAFWDRFSAAARNLDVPALLVRGGLSDIVSEDGAAEFLELAPHAEYVDVSGAGHMVVGDRNDIFDDAVISFLHRIGRPTS